MRNGQRQKAATTLLVDKYIIICLTFLNAHAPYLKLLQLFHIPIIFHKNIKLAFPRNFPNFIIYFCLFSVFLGGGGLEYDFLICCLNKYNIA